MVCQVGMENFEKYGTTQMQLIKGTWHHFASEYSHSL